MELEHYAWQKMEVQYYKSCGNEEVLFGQNEQERKWPYPNGNTSTGP
jgi:hypothetical protein